MKPCPATRLFSHKTLITVPFLGAAWEILSPLTIALHADAVDGQHTRVGECVMVRRTWTWSLARVAFVALFVAFFDPSDPGVAATDVQYVRRVIVGDTFLSAVAYVCG